jgi:CHAT domain-containing protein/tetratricopeptide (TPR) repeat protein
MHLPKNRTKHQVFSSVLVLILELAPAVITLSSLEPVWAQSLTSQQQLWQLLQQANQETAQGNRQQAIKIFQQVLKMAQQLKDQRFQAISFSGIGFNFFNLNRPQEALKYFNQALRINKALGDRIEEARTLNSIGSTYRKMGQPQKTLEFFKQALQVYKTIDNQVELVDTLNSIADIYRNDEQFEKALEYYSQSLPIYRRLGDSKRLASTLNNMGFLYITAGQNLKALTHYHEALIIYKVLGDRAGEARILNGIGYTHVTTGKLQNALEHYNQALSIQQEVGDRRGEARTLINIGFVHFTYGEIEKGLTYYERALLISKDVGDQESEVTAINNIGEVYRVKGQPEKALTYYKQVLTLSKEVGFKRSQANALTNIGALYSEIGQPQKALEYSNKALPIWKAIGNRRNEAVALQNIGKDYVQIGQHQKALEYFNQALLILKEVGDQQFSATVLHNIGGLYSEIEQPKKALEYLTQALTIRRVLGDRVGELHTLNSMGVSYANIGQLQKALENYNQSLAISKVLGNRTWEAMTLDNIAGAYRALGQSEIAITQEQQAVRLLLQTRSGMTRENRSAFLQRPRGAVVRLVRHLIEHNNPESAYSWANLFTTAELADYTRLLDEKIRDPEAQKALDQLNQQNQRLKLLYGRLEEKFSEDLAREIRSLEEEKTKQAEANIKKFPELAELLEITPTDIAELRASIPDGTTVIHPVLLTNIRNLSSEIAFFILTKDRLTVKKVHIDSKQLDTLLSQTYTQLTNRFDSGYANNLSQLYDLLIRPIETQIQATNPKQLSIIATRRLRYLPFESLYDSQTNQYLIQKYPVNYLTRLSTHSLATPPNSTAPKRVLALGNPLPQTALALIGTETEVKTIAQILPGSETLIGTQATLDAFKVQALRFPFLHLATHGCFDPLGCCLPESPHCRKPQRVDLQPNTILFADQRFNIADAALLGLQNVELITLSACQTALQTNSNGEEIAGLAYLFERAGAKATIASLWSAPDEKTQALMVQFYTNLKNGMSKSEALRQAKLSQIDSHPFFWAPFILIGDAR